MKERTLLCSTGALVGRANGFNYHLISEILPPMQASGRIDGAELMMIPAYYGHLREIADEILAAGVTFPVIHCEKEIGTKLSDAGAAFAGGDTANGRALHDAAIADFRQNCEMGVMVHASRMVFHLWGGYTSDRFVEYNVSVLPELREILAGYGMRLLIENVPSTTYDPLTNWRRIVPLPSDCGLIFDTRFGQLHRQIPETWADEAVVPFIEHIHISDIRGAARDFSTLRPIYHPGEGTIDFPAFADILDCVGYAGTVTLESPVIREGGADGEKLARTLDYLRNLLLS